MTPPFTYRGQILTVHDGDTLRVDLDLGVGTSHHDVDLGFDVHIAHRRLRLREDVRLNGCNARELAMPGGPEAGAFLASLLPAGLWVSVETFKPDKYGGRWEARITLPDGRDVTAVMCAAGYAAPWDGTGPKPVPPWPIPTPSRIEGVPMFTTTNLPEGVTDTFTFTCQCNATVHVVGGTQQPHGCPLTESERQAIRDAAADALDGS